MPDKLVIEYTSYTPKIILDPDNDIYEISGWSRPVDSNGFYNQINEWFNKNSKIINKSFEFNY